MSASFHDTHTRETQQLLASLEQRIAEPAPRVTPEPENFWQQIETLASHDDQSEE